jgi:hypothetical protein
MVVARQIGDGERAAIAITAGKAVDVAVFFRFLMNLAEHAVEFSFRKLLFLNEVRRLSFYVDSIILCERDLLAVEE